MSPAALPSIDAPWAQTDLADVATGESYRIADLTGRVVIVETMAIWCVKCLAQQRVSSRSVWDFATNLDSIRLTFGM